MDQLVAIEQRRRNLRIVLFVIILATLPFYCAGILLWGTAPRSTVGLSQTNTATFTPIGRDWTATPLPFPSITPLALSATPFSGPLLPTPGQFLPLPTRYLSPTPYLLPTDAYVPQPTAAPTLTPYPTQELPTQPPPPTQTQPPAPTDTLEPSPLPPPSDTPAPPPTDVPPDATQQASQ